MIVTVAPIPIVLGRFELSIRGPGYVRHVAFEQRKTLVMHAGAPAFEEVPVLFIEASKGSPIIKRRFIAIANGESVEPADDERAVWVGTGLSGRGLVVHVFELRPEAS